METLATLATALGYQHLPAEQQAIRVVEWASDTYWHSVYAKSLRLCRDEHTAEELAQDTMLDLLRELGDGLTFNTSVGAWLHRVIYNKTIDWLRRQKKGNDTATFDELIHSTDKYDENLTYEERQVLIVARQVVEKMGETETYIYDCIVLGGVSQRQVAFDLGVSPPTLHRMWKDIQNRILQAIDPKIPLKMVGGKS